MRDREERRERGKKIFQRVTAAGLVAAAFVQMLSVGAKRPKKK